MSYDDLHNFVHSRAAGGLRAPGNARWAFDAAVLGVWEPLAVLRRSTDGWNGHDASFSTLDVQLQTALQVRSDTPRARPT